FAGLSFLGLGVQPPAYDWGRLLGEGLSRIYVNPAAALAPGVAVVLASVAFQLGGEAVAQAVGLRTPQPRPAGPPPTVDAGPASTAAGPGATTTAADGRDAGPPLTSAAANGPASGTPPQRPVLAVEDLRVGFPTASRWVYPVDGVSFTVAPGESV